MNEDKVIEKLIEHDDRFDDIENKISSGFSSFSNEFHTGQDKMMKMLIRADEERVFTREAIRRMQDELDEQKNVSKRHEDTLQRIKMHLNLA